VTSGTRLALKMGDLFSENSFGITDKIKNVLGVSAETKIKRIAASEAECDKKLTTLYPKVVAANKEIDANNRSLSSIRSQISESELEFEMYHNSQR